MYVPDTKHAESEHTSIQVEMPVHGKTSFPPKYILQIGNIWIQSQVDKYFTRLTHVDSGAEATSTTPEFNIKGLPAFVFDNEVLTTQAILQYIKAKKVVYLDQQTYLLSKYN